MKRLLSPLPEFLPSLNFRGFPEQKLKNKTKKKKKPNLSVIRFKAGMIGLNKY